LGTVYHGRKICPAVAEEKESFESVSESGLERESEPTEPAVSTCFDVVALGGTGVGDGMAEKGCIIGGIPDAWSSWDIDANWLMAVAFIPFCAGRTGTGEITAGFGVGLPGCRIDPKIFLRDSSEISGHWARARPISALQSVYPEA